MARSNRRLSPLAAPYVKRAGIVTSATPARTNKTGQGDAGIREKILNEAFSKGLLLLGCGETSIRFCPPLCVTEDQVDTAVKLLGEAISAVG